MFANVPYKNRTLTYTFQKVVPLDPFLASMIYNTPASQKLKCTNKLKELH
jgi:hypothetical protein